MPGRELGQMAGHWWHQSAGLPSAHSSEFSQIQVDSSGFNQNENKKSEAGPKAWKFT
jgi:hypothetical protein